MSFTEWFAEQVVTDREERYEREETGRLLRMIREGLASAEVLRPRIDEVGLDHGSLLAIAMDVPDEELPGLLGVDGDTAILIGNEENVWSEPAGIGGPGPLEQLRSTLAECLVALDVGAGPAGSSAARIWPPSRPCSAASPPTSWPRSSTRLPGPLREYDGEHGTRLVETLRTFLESGGSVGAASRALFVHPNTLRHRLSRIEALTGRNPLRFEDRVALAIAIWAEDDPAPGHAGPLVEIAEPRLLCVLTNVPKGGEIRPEFRAPGHSGMGGSRFAVERGTVPPKGASTGWRSRSRGS